MNNQTFSVLDRLKMLMADSAVNDFSRFQKVILPLIVMLLLISSADAQLTSSLPANLMDSKISFDNEKKSLTASVNASANESSSLEKTVNPDEYILGPGDILGIALRGGIDDYFKEKVTPEGNLVIPFSPMINVAGLSLTEAIKKIHYQWDSFFPKTELEISLLEIRTFRILVSGAVIHPGYYNLTPADRALSAIDLAEGLYNENYWREFYKSEMTGNNWTYDDLQREHDLKLSSERNCYLIRENGDTTNLDYQKFLKGIVNIENPFLLEGDKIVVAYKPDKYHEIEISGAVVLPGKYEWRKGDTVRDLLDISGGFLEDAILDSVLYAGISEFGEMVNSEINLKDLNSPDYDILIEPYDLLVIRSRKNVNDRISVRVDGEVKYPGSYPAIEGKTRITDIIKIAGGFTDKAYIAGATVKRNRVEDSFLDIEIQRLNDFKESSGLDIEDQFKKFSKRWSDKEKIGVDFIAIYEEGDASYNQYVKDGDVINIPSRENNVLLMGMVRKPGLYPYKAGWNFQDYIDEAGGYVKNARPGIVRLVSYESSVWQKPKKSSIIGPGDLIFVPEAPVLFGWTTFKDILTVASQAATVLVVILNFTK